MQYNAVINVFKISLLLLGSREINFIRNNSTPSESLIQSAKTGFSPQQPLVWNKSNKPPVNSFFYYFVLKKREIQQKAKAGVGTDAVKRGQFKRKSNLVL